MMPLESLSNYLVHILDKDMINLFSLLKKHEKTLTEGVENKNYWEDKSVRFDDYTLGPDGNYYDQEQLYESIKESDRKRLLRFG